MQYKNFFVVYIFFVIGISNIYSDRKEEIISELKELDLWGNEDLREMSNIQECDFGYCSWRSAFMDVINSNLSLQNKLKTNVLLVELGILQTNSEAAGMNKAISSKLSNMEKLEKKFQETNDYSLKALKKEFLIRSTSVNSESSDELAPPKKRVCL